MQSADLAMTFQQIKSVPGELLTIHYADLNTIVGTRGIVFILYQVTYTILLVDPLIFFYELLLCGL